MTQLGTPELLEQAAVLGAYSLTLCRRTETFIAALQSTHSATKGKQAQALAGMRKFHRRLQQDMKFLQSMMLDTTTLTENKLRSSNLSNFEGMLDILETERDISGVWQTFCLEGSGTKADVDIVSCGGMRWFKVKASTRGLEEAIGGMGRFGEKSIFEQLDIYRALAATKLVQCTAPEVYVYFLHPIPAYVAEGLHAMNIRVLSPADLPLPPIGAAAFPSSLCDGTIVDLPLALPRANLDVTAMVALCSELTNDPTPCRFPAYNVLDLQAIDEATNHVLPLLQTFLEGKCVIASRRAVEEFRGILEHVGGERERARAEVLLSATHVVPDNPAEHVMRLRLTSRIGDRQRVIFGTGETYRSVTVTANRQFIQAAADQGVSITNFIHSARALTGKKMLLP